MSLSTSWSRMGTPGEIHRGNLLRGNLLRGSLDAEIEVDAMAFNDGFMLAGLALHDDPSVENLGADLWDNRNEVDLHGLVGVRVTDRVPRLRHRGRSTPFRDASP